MRILGLMTVRNEEWILGYSARVALKWCDGLVILDHASTDRTPEILQALAAEFPRRIYLLRAEGDDWTEMAHRQTTLDAAYGLGATHCAIVDADEFLTANLIPEVREMIRALESGESLDLPMIPAWSHIDMRRVDPCVWTRGVISLAFRLIPGLAWKKAEDGYEHHHRCPYGIKRAKRMQVEGGVVHAQWADWWRLTAKHALYKLREVERWPGRMSAEQLNKVYGEALDETGLKVERMPASWISPGRIEPTVPWQVQAARDLAAKLGPERIKGLDLFGVVP